MTGLVFHVVLVWPMFIITLLVFGFAPGAVLRLIVLAFRAGDPRRRELLAELHAVPRMERPFWVAEQLEVALFEGLPARAATWQIRARLLGAPGCFYEANGLDFIVSSFGVYVASKHLDVDGAYLPLDDATASLVLGWLAADSCFSELPRRTRRLVFNFLAEGAPDPAPEFWAKKRPCPVCGADCYQREQWHRTISTALVGAQTGTVSLRPPGHWEPRRDPPDQCPCCGR